jgi:hypothetical protein
VLSVDGGSATVRSVTWVPAAEAVRAVHNVTVDETSTYFIGVRGVLVHNIKDEDSDEEPPIDETQAPFPRRQ